MAKLVMRWIEKPYQIAEIPNRENVGQSEYDHAVRCAADNLVHSSGIFQRNADITSIRFEIEED